MRLYDYYGSTSAKEIGRWIIQYDIIWYKIVCFCTILFGIPILTGGASNPLSQISE